MSTWRGRVLSSLLLVLLLGVAAAAQEQAPLVRVVALPGGGAELLLTRVDAERGVASSELLALGGGQAAQSAPAADGTAGAGVCCPQRFISRYKDVFGWFHQLMTQEESGESAEAHALRHAAAVAVLVAEFPPAASTSSLGPASIEPGEQVFKTSWHGADGLDHEVETARRPNETTEKWAQRHAEGVAAMLALFPPAPGFSAAGAGALRTVV